ncbi:MAG: hypothetical protein PUC63_07305, partial [Clostridiales bacterium]|nr:hypothetical protein [Clostridiales bacterium]
MHRGSWIQQKSASHTFTHNYHARTYNYGTTFCKNDDSTADSGIFVSFSDLNAICQRNSILLEGALAED